LSKIITGDETWCFEYGSESKRQNLQWKKLTSPQPNKACMSNSQVKKVIITFFYIKCSGHFEFIPQDQKVNQAYYVEILKRLCEAVHRKGPELWPSDWILQYKSAPGHKALYVKQFLAQKSITEMKHPPYSPDLAPNDFWMFPEIKSELTGRRYQDTEDIEKM
jgi:histone-lysine N-methyltransferase SETMAR